MQLMTDNLTAETRRRTMQLIRSSDTRPELKTRQFLHRLGFRFRLHDENLAGKPDVVLPRYKTAVFVHGCFWHSHGCDRSVVPKTRLEYWVPKLAKTRDRDARSVSVLRKCGWRVIIVWECQTASTMALRRRFHHLLEAQKVAQRRLLRRTKVPNLLK